MPRTLARRTSYGLLVVFALLTPAAIVGTWAQRHLVDEQGNLQTVAPLSSDTLMVMYQEPGGSGGSGSAGDGTGGMLTLFSAFY